MDFERLRMRDSTQTVMMLAYKAAKSVVKSLSLQSSFSFSQHLVITQINHSCPFIVATDTVLVLEARHLCGCHFHELHFDWNTNRLLAKRRLDYGRMGCKHHNSESPNALMFRSTIDILHGYDVFADVWDGVFTLTSKAKISLPMCVFS